MKITIGDGAEVGVIYGGHRDKSSGQGAILLVGTEDKAYTGSVGNFSGFENVVVTKGSSMTTTSATANIFDATIHTYTVTQENMTQAITTTAGTVAVNAIAWASVYGSASRISNQGSATGANYSIYGAAVGAEFLLNSARSLGIAFGYDWGKTSPLDSSSGIDQNAMHIALYGRAGQWDVGSKGCIAFDWSASVGKVDSDSPDVSSAWCQDTLQLDARLSYIHPLTEKLNASAFVGANPGRLGAGITAGAAYRTNKNWNFQGSYSLETADNSTAHTINLGVFRSF
ncbi:MAG: autotransporter outer membrane beta-barrel domain-containing protein [Akkermansia sp.]|nr:autotransporter outer membrane beta-barrel domain-containing protein [Akkermansia sp.]